jgi:hypothetical protein
VKAVDDGGAIDHEVAGVGGGHGGKYGRCGGWGEGRDRVVKGEKARWTLTAEKR